MTQVLEREQGEELLEDDEPWLVHLFCCNPKVTLCNEEVEDAYYLVTSEVSEADICVVCHELDESFAPCRELTCPHRVDRWTDEWT